MKLQILFLFLISAIYVKAQETLVQKKDSITTVLTEQEKPKLVVIDDKDIQDNSVEEQIKIERDIELNRLQVELLDNKKKLTDLTTQLSMINERKYQQKIALQEKIQKELDKRIRFLEESPKIKIKSNGQLAFTELIKIQKDIQPAKLYLSSNGFYTKLGKFDNLQDYSEFTEWKKQYDKWYQKKKGSNSTYDFINKSITLLSDASSNIPLFGSISQTVVSGITIIFSNLKGRNKALAEKTPQVLTLLNSIGQFEGEKSLLDSEWKVIDKELKELHNEYEKLIEHQIKFYGISDFMYQNFLSATLDADIEEFKVYSKDKILKRLNTLEAENSPNWMAKVEKYMYQVQSIRVRFGQLTTRMLANIEKYEELFSKYNDSKKFSSEFVEKAKDLSEDLAEVKKNFVLTFKPNQYIEDSAVMYLKR